MQRRQPERQDFINIRTRKELARAAQRKRKKSYKVTGPIKKMKHNPQTGGLSKLLFD